MLFSAAMRLPKVACPTPCCATGAAIATTGVDSATRPAATLPTNVDLIPLKVRLLDQSGCKRTPSIRVVVWRLSHLGSMETLYDIAVKKGASGNDRGVTSRVVPLPYRQRRCPDSVG